MHLYINANSFIQTGTIPSDTGSRLFDVKRFSDLVLTPEREANFESHTGPFSPSSNGQDIPRRVLLCMLDHSRRRNCTADLSGRRPCQSGSEAPRRETPCQEESGTVVSRDATRPCQENSRRPSRGVARPWQPCHRGRCHACSRL